MISPSLPLSVDHKRVTPGVACLIALMAVGLCFGVYRFFWGLAASTNLSQSYPWGIWIVADVSFIALAGAGFTTAALVHVFHREQFHILVRPALVTALLGYTFACVLLAADLGRYYNIWHPLLPIMWQGNSALFEVGMCVMCYLTVLYIEFIPVFCEWLMHNRRYPALARVCAAVHRFVSKTMFVVLVAGVAISCLHQSSLGHVLVLAPSKLHPLWWTPVLAILFLWSAIAAGFPVVTFVMITASYALRRRPPMNVLANLAQYIPFFLSVYLLAKVTDLLVRGSYTYLLDGSLQSVSFLVEMVAGVVVPAAMTCSPTIRRSPKWLAVACALVMFGIILNRANVYWIGYRPAFAQGIYYPSLAEWAFTVGAAAAVVFLWRLIATYLPIFTPADGGHAT